MMLWQRLIFSLTPRNALCPPPATFMQIRVGEKRDKLFSAAQTNARNGLLSSEGSSRVGDVSWSPPRRLGAKKGDFYVRELEATKQGNSRFAMVCWELLKTHGY